MSNNKVFVCNCCTDHLYDDNVTIGGLNIQMHLWAKNFVNHGWKVMCLTHLKKHSNVLIDGIQHIYQKKMTHFITVRDFFWYVNTILKHRPELILLRGRGVDVYPIALLSKLLGIKFVFFVAADTNMAKGNEAKQNFETKLFRKSIKFIKYIIAQNTRQQQQIKDNYLKDSLIIPNIWENVTDTHTCMNAREEIIWVGNIKTVKRPEWYLDLAERFPTLHFAMIGGPSDPKMFNDCLNRSKNLPNLEIVGRLGLNETNERFKKAKLLVCTSVSEGFPNTFLQAWSNGIPVVSTVNPNNLLIEKNLGFVCNNVDELAEAISKLNGDVNLYNQYSDNVRKYFTIAHDMDTNYNLLINYVYEKAH